MTIKHPGLLTAYTSTEEIDVSADLFMGWDGSAGQIKTLVGASLPRVALRWYNVGDPTFGSAWGDRLKNCLAATASGGGIVYIPPVSVSVSADTYAIAGDNVHIVATGANINFSGGQGLILTGDAQDNVSLKGGTFTNWVGTAFGIPADGTQDDTTKSRINVEGVTFKDATSSATSGNGLNVEAIKLSCRTKQCRITNNVIENLSHTASGAVNSTVYGIILGRNGNEMGGSRTGEAYSYGFDGTSTNAEGSDYIAGNTVRKLRNSSATATVNCTGILAEGWRQVVTENTVEDIQYIGSGVTGYAGIGIYIRGFDITVSKNHLSDCTSGQVWTKNNAASASYGDLGGYLIEGNTFRTMATLAHSRAAAQKIIGLYNGRTKVLNNLFDKCTTRGNGVGLSGVIIEPGDAYSDIEISGNTFLGCTSEVVYTMLGTRMTFNNNRIINPVGPYLFSGNWLLVNSNVGGAYQDWQVNDNTLIIRESDFAASGTCYFFNFNQSAALVGLSVQRNKILGWSSAGPTETWRLTNINNSVAGNDHWTLAGNSTDCPFGTGNIEFYHGVTVTGGGSYPVHFRREWDFGDVVKKGFTANTTLADDESGLTCSNAGATGSVTLTLPAAVPGTWYRIYKQADYPFIVDPNGSQTIGALSGGEAVTLNGIGDELYLFCTETGKWDASVSDSFEFNVRDYGAKGDNTTNDTDAIQDAIDAAEAVGGGTIYFPRGTYLSRALTLTSNGLRIRGDGRTASVLMFSPTAANQTLLTWDKGGSILKDCGIEDITLGTNEYTYNKTAIKITDLSEFAMTNVRINGYTGNVDAVGIRTYGRQNLWAKNVEISATVPIVIDKNPNTTAGYLSADSFHFDNVSLINDGNVPSGLTNAMILVQPGAHISQFHWKGGGWVTKRHGFYWDNDASENVYNSSLHFENIRTEGISDATSYYSFYVDTSASSFAKPLYNFSISKSEINANCNGFYMNGVSHIGIYDTMCHQASPVEVINVSDAYSMTFERVSTLQTATTAAIVIDSNMFLLEADPYSENFKLPANARWARRSTAAQYNERPTQRNGSHSWEFGKLFTSGESVQIPTVNVNDWEHARIEVVASRESTNQLEYGTWIVAPVTGLTNGVVKASGSTNTAVTDAASNLCVYCPAGNMDNVYVKNNLGGSAYVSVRVFGIRSVNT